MDFMQAMQFRHACKIFDDSKQVSEDDEKKIIEFARLSPSSFGFEPWHFLVIRNQELRQKMRPTCWDQVQITSSSFVVVILARKAHFFRPDSEYFRQRMWRRSQTEERFTMVKDRVMTFLTDQPTSEWAKKQTYIALANMMTGAASLGIDSCPIEGFYSDQLKAVLHDYADWSSYEPVVLAAFGHRLNEQTPLIREPLENIATFID